MTLEQHIAQFSLDDILAIEHNDKQFVVLQNARNRINTTTDKDKKLFVFLVMQCAIVGFQIAGSGPLRREEFADKIQTNWNVLQELQYDNVDRWYQFLTTSRYNKRLYNNKRKRLEKFAVAYNMLVENKSMLDYHQTMSHLRTQLSKAMQQDPYNKTMAFTIKMYGYATRIVTKHLIHYPMDIVIPLDSRLRAIAIQQDVKYNQSNDTHIIAYYQDLADKYNIPPLHLDSLIWIDYREKYC
jgi:DNA-(apurinic or apyrimidinic site) lyase